MKIQCTLQPEEFHIHTITFLGKMPSQQLHRLSRRNSCPSLGQSWCILSLCSSRREAPGLSPEIQLPNASAPLKPQSRCQSPGSLNHVPCWPQLGCITILLRCPRSISTAYACPPHRLGLSPQKPLCSTLSNNNQHFLKSLQLYLC